MRLFSSLLLVSFIFLGCSSKQYFEPEDTYSFQGNISSLEEEIKILNKDGATLENNKFISKDEVSLFTLDEGYHFLNKIDEFIFASNSNGQLLIKEADKKETIVSFKNNVIAVSKKDDLLAVVFSNNIVGLYDLVDKKFKVKEYLKSSVLNDIRIANPIFLDDIVLLPTLDGKIIIVNIVSYKTIKTINVDPNGKINNVIFLSTIGDTMVAATSNKVLALSDGSFAIKDYTIKDIITNESNVFIATLDGRIIKLNFALEKIYMKKFKFAKIHSLVFGDSLYALESEGYLIQLNDDFSDVKVYDFGFDEDEKTIAIGDTLYFDDSYIKLK